MELNKQKKKLVTAVKEHTDDDYRVEIIKNSLAYIHQHYGEKFYVHTLAQNAGLNEQYFCRFFKKYIGKTPVAISMNTALGVPLLCFRIPSVRLWISVSTAVFIISEIF